jgi:hypothetical protein
LTELGFKTITLILFLLTSQARDCEKPWRSEFTGIIGRRTGISFFPAHRTFHDMLPCSAGSIRKKSLCNEKYSGKIGAYNFIQSVRVKSVTFPFINIPALFTSISGIPPF